MVKETMFGSLGFARDNPDPGYAAADRPCDLQTGDDMRADCGCRTYWVQGEEKQHPDYTATSDHWWKWEAIHEIQCDRIIVRRREAIEHSRNKL